VFRWGLLSTASEDKACNSQDDENKEQNLCDSYRTGCNATESENGSDECDDKKDDGVVKHGGSPEGI